MKYIILYILGIPLFILASCSGANDTGFDANRNSEQKTKTSFFPDFNPADIDSTSNRPRPKNSPKTAPTEEFEDDDKDLKWILLSILKSSPQHLLSNQYR